MDNKENGGNSFLYKIKTHNIKPARKNLRPAPKNGGVPSIRLFFRIIQVVPQMIHRNI